MSASTSPSRRLGVVPGNLSETETTPLLLDGGRFLLSTELGPSQSSLASSSEGSSTWAAFKSLFKRLLPSLCYFGSIAGFYVFVWLLWTLLHTRYGLPRQVAPVMNGSFSGLAAWEHVKAITVAPHMYNSRENLRVRQYILNELKELQSRALASNRTGLTVGLSFALNSCNKSF
jgi:hypothetical protein